MTFMVGDKVACCGGYTVAWPGVAEMWLNLSQDFAAYPGVVVEIKNQVKEWIEEEGLVRVQMTVKSGWKEGERFLSWLGLEREGVMRKFLPDGSDAVLYARVR